jgi:hypothetical protein
MEEVKQWSNQPITSQQHILRNSLFTVRKVAGFQVLRAVVMNNSISIQSQPTFGGAFCFNLQCRRISQEKKQNEPNIKQCFVLLPWRMRQLVPPKRRLTFNGLHGVISHKLELFNSVPYFVLFWASFIVGLMIVHHNRCLTRNIWNVPESKWWVRRIT